MNNSPTDNYQKRLDLFSAEFSGLKNRITKVALVRGAIFILGLSGTIWFFNENGLLSLGIFLVSLFAFLYLMELHSKLFKRKTHVGYLSEINEDELDYQKLNFGRFDNGKDFSDISHPYSGDLDIFGQGSLFQYLNRSETVEGKMRVSDWLGNPGTEESIVERQNAMLEMAEKTDWRQDFQAIGKTYSDTEKGNRELKQWLEDAPILAGDRMVQMLRLVMPLILLIGIILSIVEMIPFSVPFGLFFLNLGIAGIYVKKVNHIHEKTGREFEMFTKYARLIESFEQESFNSVLLLQLKQQLATGGRSAYKRISRLASLIKMLDGRLNLLIAVFMNGLVLWDLHYGTKVELWKAANKTELPKWLKVTGELEALVSLGTFRYNHPAFVMPVISAEKMLLRTTGLAHLLLPDSERVANDVEVSKWSDFILITGSNMAGKSTFLRSVGMNMILSMMGAPVCAKSFEFYPVRLFTSMRVIDSIQNRESTFYAELKRLKMIISALEVGPVFILLDEILKGTNSRDKLSGSIAFVKQLIASGAAGFIATHDLALGKLQNEYPSNLRNYCFEVDAHNGKFVFDYKLKEGICSVQNATQLMRSMGLKVEG